MEILLKKQNGVVRILEWFGELGLFCVRTLKSRTIRCFEGVRTEGVVRKYLIDNFKIEESKIKTKGFGEQSSKQKDAEQSRVEILIYSQKADLRVSSN